MSEPKWTPGPWQPREFPDDWDVGGPERGSSCAFCIGTSNDVVATVYGAYPDDSQGRNDAHLITAAPDLYAALLDAVVILESAAGILNRSHDTTTPIEAGLAALAKARGVTP